MLDQGESRCSRAASDRPAVNNGNRSSPGSEGHCASVHLGGRPAASEPAAEVGEGPALEVTVIFTSAQATMTALKTAQGLARNLNARISLLVPQVVPPQFSPTSPPVSIPFTESRCYALAIACRQDIEIQVHVYLCGDKRQCLLKVLKPESLVVMGGRKRWWPPPNRGWQESWNPPACA